KAAEQLEMVGINPERLRSFAHELSGGMRQRAMIAMALALDPQVVIFDEPTTALDVVTQREILEELMGLRDRLGFAALFITHDLSLLVELADEIAVMYAGRVMERAPAGPRFRPSLLRRSRGRPPGQCEWARSERSQHGHPRRSRSDQALLAQAGPGSIRAPDARPRRGRRIRAPRGGDRDRAGRRERRGKDDSGAAARENHQARCRRGAAGGQAGAGRATSVLRRQGPDGLEGPVRIAQPRTPRPLPAGATAEDPPPGGRRPGRGGRRPPAPSRVEATRIL